MLRTLKVYMAHDRVNGKCYFGSTFQTLEKRIRAHVYTAKKASKRSHFQAALLKRPDKFFWVVLEEVQIEIDPNSKSVNNSSTRRREQEWIERYWGQPWLYNLKKEAVGFGTGNSNPNQTQAWKDRMKVVLSGANNPMSGGHKPETIEKISSALKGRAKPESMREKMRGLSNNGYGRAPWETSNCKDKSIWINADKIYERWKETKHGGIRLSKFFTEIQRSSSSFSFIVGKFKKGWIPKNDPKWVEFVKDIV